MSWPSRMGVAVLALGTSLGLAGCGFQPLYQSGSGQRTSAEGSTSLADVQQVQIAPIGERIGQQLHNALRDLMNPMGQPGDPAYRLRVSLDDRENRTNLRGDAIATRVVRELRASWELVDTATGERVFRGSSRSFNSYDVLDQPYATLAAQRAAAQRGVKDLARNINNRVAAFLARPRDQAEAPQ